MLPRAIRDPLECSLGTNPDNSSVVGGLEPADVADLGDQTNRADGIDPTQHLQRVHHRLEAPAGKAPRSARVSRATRSSATLTPCQYSVSAVWVPAPVKLNVASHRQNVLLLRIPHVVAQQEAFQLMPRLGAGIDRIFPRRARSRIAPSAGSGTHTARNSSARASSAKRK